MKPRAGEWATIAFYGPDDSVRPKSQSASFQPEDADADPLQRWFSEHVDARSDFDIAR
jgi:hypothetical protein